MSRRSLAGIGSAVVVLSLVLTTFSAAASVNLTGMAVESCLASTHSKFRITNDYGEEISYTWTAYGSGLTGSGTVGPEHTMANRWTNPYYFYVPQPPAVTVVLSYTWSGGSGSKVKSSGTATYTAETPSIACLDPIVVSTDPGVSGAIVTWSPTVTGDPTPTVICSPVSGSFFPIGETTVTCTATNVCGTDTCTFTVTVLPPELVPAGLVEFLDRGWEAPAGGGGGVTEPPVVGELLVTSQYEVGELITGCCAIVDGTGNPADVEYVTMTWYAVTIGDDFFDIREPIDARLLYQVDGKYCFQLETKDWALGYYDIRLGAPFLDHVFIRVEVVAPLE